MVSLRNILLTGTILLGSLAQVIDAQELFNTHFQNFNQEISKKINNPSHLKDSNLIIKAQEGYELDKDEQEEIKNYFQNNAGSYIADEVIKTLKKSWLRKYIEPIEKITKGVEISVPKSKDKVKVKPDIDFDSESNFQEGFQGSLQGGLDFSYRNLGLSTRSDRVRARINFFKQKNKSLNIEFGYDEGLFFGFRAGTIY